jgi:hypothetical protein
MAVGAAHGQSGDTSRKKLIEWGWDQPTTAFMRRHIEQMERSPFDGCVFSAPYDKPNGKRGSFTWEGWGRRAFVYDELAPALADLKATKFTRFQDNFLRFNTTPADLDWFDDFASVLNNARLAARFAREGGCKGLLFDIEQYNFHLFDYRKQRDREAKSWEVYAAQVRRRGREVMEAFQKEYPDITLFLPFGYSMPWVQSGRGRQPLAEKSYGLVAPFMDGLIDAANGRSRIIDGDEIAYGYKDPDDFVRSRRAMREDLLPMIGADREKYLRVISVSFGIWPDNDWRKRGWDLENFEKNYHTPERFETLVRAALQNADEYVWIYTEKPRWWTDEGQPADLPAAYDRALRRARESAGQSADAPK